MRKTLEMPNVGNGMDQKVPKTRGKTKRTFDSDGDRSLLTRSRYTTYQEVVFTLHTAATMRGARRTEVNDLGYSCQPLWYSTLHNPEPRWVMVPWAPWDVLEKVPVPKAPYDPQGALLPLKELDRSRNSVRRTQAPVVSVWAARQTIMRDLRVYGNLRYELHHVSLRQHDLAGEALRDDEFVLAHSHLVAVFPPLPKKGKKSFRYNKRARLQEDPFQLGKKSELRAIDQMILENLHAVWPWTRITPLGIAERAANVVFEEMDGRGELSNWLVLRQRMEINEHLQKDVEKYLYAMYYPRGSSLSEGALLSDVTGLVARGFLKRVLDWRKKFLPPPGITSDRLYIDLDGMVRAIPLPF